MINHNGTLETGEYSLANNRAFKYGDAVFETIKVLEGKILYWEDHYFRLMASMRIIRMDIPMEFTMEFLEAEILKTLAHNDLSSKVARVRMTVYREAGGLYTPESTKVAYLIDVKPLVQRNYVLDEVAYEVDLFKDHYITPQLLSTLKTNNRVLNVIAGIFAKENELSNCLLLNSNKHVVEAINGNLFLVKGNVIKTPPLSDGCIKGVFRKQLIDLLGGIEEYQIEEVSISPFELQKADELFITNVIQGIVSISKYRKKTYANKVAKDLIKRLNAKILLG